MFQEGNHRLEQVGISNPFHGDNHLTAAYFPEGVQENGRETTIRLPKDQIERFCLYRWLGAVVGLDQFLDFVH